MKLHLTNFKSHRNATFIIPETGVTLIHGKTGTGKSTIFKAILFALYGKVKKPYSHESKSCNVELESAKMSIYISRTFTPNKLIVKYPVQSTESMQPKGENTYESDAAQGVIDKVMKMNESEFLISSYFDQRKQSSILSMSSIDQLQFVETISRPISGDGDCIDSVKNKIKSHQKMLDQERSKFISQLELLNSQINSINEIDHIKITKLEPSEKNLDIKSIKNDHANLLDKLQDIQSDLSIKRVELEKIRKQEIELSKLEKEKDKLETILECYIEARTKLGKVISEEEIGKLVNQSSSLSKIIQDIEDAIEVDKLFFTFDTLSKEYFSKLEENLVDLQNKLIEDNIFLEKCNSLFEYESSRLKYEQEENQIKLVTEQKTKAVEDLENILNDLMKIYNLKKIPRGPKNNLLIKFINTKKLKHIQNISTLEKKIEIVTCEILICPNCENTLVLKDEKLLKIERPKNLPLVDINDLKLILENEKILNDKLISYCQILVDIQPKLELIIPKNTKNIMSLNEFQELTLLIANQKEIRSKISILEKQVKEKNIKTLPEHILSLNIKYKDKKKGLPKKLDRSQNISELQEKVENIDINVKEAWRVRGEYSKLTREISATEKILKTQNTRFLNPITKPNTIDNLSKNIISLESESKSILNQISKLQTQITIADKYEVYERNQKDLEKLNNKKIEIEEKLNTINFRILNVDKLESAAKEAEFLVLEKTIRSINEHAKIYLDKIFENGEGGNSVYAQLYVKRVTKSGKTAVRPSIDIKIEIDGVLCDIDDDLCGGERQRCDLAFLFGVNDMMGSDLILLDECVNNLDNDTNTEVLKYIQKVCGDKQILVIAHEATHGIFDNIYDISQIK
jgi:DNA repair exonuclease SbcCD ATPase subunit